MKIKPETYINVCKLKYFPEHFHFIGKYDHTLLPHAHDSFS